MLPLENGKGKKLNWKASPVLPKRFCILYGREISCSLDNKAKDNVNKEIYNNQYKT